MKDWIFLSKDGEDEYIEKLARSCGGKIVSTDDFVYEDSDRPIVLRGILKHKIMKRCWDDGIVRSETFRNLRKRRLVRTQK